MAARRFIRIASTGERARIGAMSCQRRQWLAVADSLSEPGHGNDFRGGYGQGRRVRGDGIGRIGRRRCKKVWTRGVTWHSRAGGPDEGRREQRRGTCTSSNPRPPRGVAARDSLPQTAQVPHATHRLASLLRFIPAAGRVRANGRLQSRPHREQSRWFDQVRACLAHAQLPQPPIARAEETAMARLESEVRGPTPPSLLIPASRFGPCSLSSCHDSASCAPCPSSEVA